jgi:gas vesicle protein
METPTPTRNNTTTLITVALAAAATGALLGILFAPDKGSVTRSKLSGRARQIAGNLSETLGIRRHSEEHAKTPAPGIDHI